MAMRLRAGTCDDSEGCGRAFTATECCVCPQCEAVFCADCWSNPRVHWACKQAENDELERFMEDEAEAEADHEAAHELGETPDE